MSLSITNALLQIGTIIQSTELQDFPLLIKNLLTSRNNQIKQLAAPLLTPTGLKAVLTALLDADRSVSVLEWATEHTCNNMKLEICQVAHKESGLHFDASHAHAADVLGFDLSYIASVYKDYAPLAWRIIQALLDANGDAHRCKWPNTGISNYGRQYKEDEVSLGDVMRPQETRGDGTSDTIVEEEHESSDDTIQRNNALLKIVRGYVRLWWEQRWQQ